MRTLIALLTIVAIGYAEPLRWDSLGDNTPAKKAAAKPKMFIIEEAESDCGCSPCRCADHVGSCPCGRMREMPKAKVQAATPSQFHDITKLGIQQPQPKYFASMPMYQQPSVPLYWGGVGNVANCVGGA